MDQGENSFWSFCVDYLETSGAPASSFKERDGNVRNKVDYRELLRQAIKGKRQKELKGRDSPPACPSPSRRHSAGASSHLL